MSDFGRELSDSAFDITGKLIGAVLRLLEKVFDTIAQKFSVEHRLKKAELDALNEQKAHKKYAEKVDGMTGYVKYEDLRKAGVPLTSCEITLDDKGFKELASYCEREGIAITGVEDIRERNMTGNKSFVIMCKQTDLERIGSLIDLMNDQKRIDKINEKIDDIQGKNADLVYELTELIRKPDKSREEIARVGEIQEEIKQNNLVIYELEKQQKEIRFRQCSDMNWEHIYRADAMSDMERAAYVNSLKNYGFEESLNRMTDKKIDKDMDYYVVDAKNPDRYILCHTANDTFEGKTYLKTTYEVYKDGECVLTCDDARFEGRPKDYWMNLKTQIKTAGDFGEQLFKFYSKQEYELYRDCYMAENEAEIDGLDVDNPKRDISKNIEILKAQLKELGAEYVNGEVVNTKDGTQLDVYSTDNVDVRMNIREVMIIGQQITNYIEIQRVEDDMAVAKAELFLADEGTEQYHQIESKLKSLTSKREELLEDEKYYVDKRKDINTAQAYSATEKSLEPEIQQLEAQITKFEREIEKNQESFEKNDDLDAHIRAQELTFRLKNAREKLVELKGIADSTGDSSLRVKDEVGADKTKNLEEYKSKIAKEKAMDEGVDDSFDVKENERDDVNMFDLSNYE